MTHNPEKNSNRIKIALLLWFISLAGISFSQPSRLSVSPNGRLLVDEQGNTVFLNGDTGWTLPSQLSREDAEHYIKVRKSQDFNLIGVAAIFGDDPKNFYGDFAFEKTNGKWDPTKPLTTKGNNPDIPEEYDYWDNLDYIVGLTEKHNLYITLVICFNGWVTGSGDGKDRSPIVFNQKNAYEYGYFIGERYKHKKNILWMIGGDRSAVYGEFDYTAVYRAMAEGCADGIKGNKKHDGKYDISGILMSFHPQKGNPNSAEWFHNDEWLTFNSIQACPSTQESLIETDYSMDPVKPVWLFEGRYEHYTSAYKPWHVRFQAYLSIFAGGFGHVYGNEAIWDFDPSWKTDLYWDGAMHMKYMNYIFNEGLSKCKFGDLKPNGAVIANRDRGRTTSECWITLTLEAPYSNRVVAMATDDYSTVIVYSADGSTIQLRKALLPKNFLAYWYSPRTGRWTEHKEINHKKPLDKNAITTNDELVVFDLPGNPGFDNDWILLIERED